MAVSVSLEAQYGRHIPRLPTDGRMFLGTHLVTQSGSYMIDLGLLTAKVIMPMGTQVITNRKSL